MTSPVGSAANALRSRLRAVMARGVDEPLGEGAFNELALDVFRFQAEAVRPYGAYVRAQGIDPGDVRDWRDIPPVPARAFRELPLVAGGAEPQALFRTSGTTSGGGPRGEHRVLALSLYRDSLLPNARAHLNPAADRTPSAGSAALRNPASGRLRVLALLPSPDARSDSSLAHMGGVLFREWDDGGGGFLLDAAWRLDVDRARASLESARADGVPVLLLGTAFAFVHLLDHLAEAGWSARLPAGSRIMETGGFKGRSRVVSRAELYRRISEVTEVPQRRIVNEYGMTELLSQFYEPVLLEDDVSAETRVGTDPAERHLVGPPWVRTRVLDPSTLRPLPDGEPGLLCHLDLANLYSVSAVLTEDLGTSVPGGFRVHGRGAGAEPRGCSLAMEELLAVRERDAG